MRTCLHILTATLVVLFAGGCASSGAFRSTNVTNVELAEANYEIVATNVRGEASAEYLFGVSTPWLVGSRGPHMQTAALLRLDGSGLLYEEAIADLWQTYREQYGEVEGQALALVNVRYDAEALNLLVFTRPTVSVRADVVRFQ